jgi:hypothetical protein
MPGTAPPGSVISGSYRLTAGASSGAAVMRLAYSFVAGMTYNFTFTGMQGSQALVLSVYQYNAAGTTAIPISADSYNITTSATTISGSFTANLYPATYTGTIVFYVQALAVNQYVNFTTFSMTTSTLNVGIGTSAPNENLTVYGSGVGLRNATAGYFQVGLASGPGQYSASAVSADSIIRAISGNLMIQTGSGAAGIYINSSNYIGMGTATVTYPLDIYNNTTILARFQQSVDYARVILDAPSGGDIIYKVAGVSKYGIACISNKLQFLLNDSTSTIPMTLDTTGFVGIGSTGPGYLLTVGTNANPTANSAGTTVLQCNGNLNIFRNRLIFSSNAIDWNHCIYNNSFNLDNEGAWDGMKFNVYNGAWFRVGTAAATVPTTAMFISTSGQVSIGTTSPVANTILDIRGAVTINNGSTYANASGFMAAGSLTIGSTTVNYGGASTWSSSTAGLLMECLNNTEIAVHDTGERVASFMYYNANNITIGRNMGWGVSSVYIAGALSKSSGAFDIEHPLYPDTSKRLVHSFVEGPRCDLIYRGKTTLVNGTAVVDINKECTHSPECAMDDGTFEALCANPQIFLQNNQSFDRVRGAIAGCILTITCENPVSNMVIEWMVIAERVDPFIKQWDRTNPDGYLITQYTK